MGAHPLYDTAHGAVATWRWPVGSWARGSVQWGSATSSSGLSSPNAESSLALTEYCTVRKCAYHTSSNKKPES